MKKILVSVAFAAALLAACNEAVPSDEMMSCGALTVFLQGEPATKAGGPAEGLEGVLTESQVFIFNEDGTLYRKESIAGNGTTMTATNIKAGSYTVAVLCNYVTEKGDSGNLDPASLSDLEASEVSLAYANPARSFVMYGKAPGVTVVAGEDPAAAAVTVSRFVSRVRLVSVENEIPDAYGDLTLDYAFLENAFGAWTLSASGNPAEPVNWGGRSAGQEGASTTGIINGSTQAATYPDQTFHAPGQDISKGADHKYEPGWDFYTFPNPTTATDDHFSGGLDVTSPALTRLVLHASFKGNAEKQFYYPVTILGPQNVPLARNTAYDVTVIIRGEGVLDPNEEPQYGSVAVVVTPADWEDGGEIRSEF